MKAAKALKEKGETPEELLQSIKENEAAAAEAERVVDAWKAIVGEKARREEAAKAEAERIATEKAEAERKAAEERERAEAEEEQRAAEEKRIAEEKAEAERKAQEERERAEEERDRIEAELDAQKADEEARLEAERKAEEEAVEKDAELKEDKKKPQLKDVVKAIYEKGKSAASRLYKMAFFDVAKTPDFMKKLGLTGDRFTIKYGVLSRHAGKDDSHSLTEKQWEELPDALQKPFAITRFGGKDKGYRLYTTMKNENGETIVVGVDVKNVGRDMEVNAISTIFGRRGDAKKTQKEDVLYTAENITPEQRSLLGQPNSDQYTGVRERNVSIDKGSEKPEKKQEKQSVFDKAKEIADKEEKKRKAEAEDDSVLGQATRAVGKKKKVNLFKYTVSEKNSNSALRGVHYANGYAYASDGYILFKEKADYPKEWEGTTRDKDGNLIDGKYPDAEKAIHRLVHIPDKEVESLPSKEVLDFAIAASKKLKVESIPVAIDGIFFNAVNLKKFLEAVASKGMDKVVYRHPMLYATNGKDEIVLMPTVNTLERALDIADKMESAGLPKEQIDAWKAHIEAADKKMSFEDFKKAVENAKKEGVRPTEAEKPKEQPLTEAERKDAEEVAGALGYRVEWVDTMEENGTIDADRKVIRIAKDAENPLVQVLGHEVAHGVRRMIGGKFRTLQKAAKEVVGEKEWNERIEKKRKLNAYAEGKLAEEVTCDIVGEALNDKDALKRLAESLRGEKGILARLRDAVARMVEYFKNRGDKDGVRRMKAADKLLAEFESALKEGVAPEQVKPEGVDRSVRESGDEPENKRRKDFAERFGVDESYVSDYANGMAQKNTGKAARARRSMERQIYLANAGKTSKLSDIAKSLKPFRAALKEAFGDLDALIDEYRKLFEEERNMMEAARKKAEEEAAARKRHLDELSLLTDGQIDSRYAEALEKGDETEAREMLDEVARRKGYGDENNEYRMQHRAPSNPGYESDEARRNDIENGPDVNLEDIALGYNRQPDDYFTNPRGYGNDTPHGRESTDAVANALSSIRQGGRDVTVKVYRAVPTTMKEGKLRNGDWVTLSRRYAEMHGNHALNGKYRIMEDEVPAKDIWWDGNDVNEFGYDNGEDYKYKNVKNNRKSDDLVTRDDKGNVIPPSKRFNQRKADERYSRMESKALTAEERELRDNLVERMRKGGLDVVTDSEEMQRVIDTENERTRNMFVGEKGATEADKAEEVSSRLDNLSVARRMEEAEKDAKAIKMATGWERGSDGKWRYETSDIKPKPFEEWMDKKNLKLGDIIDSDSGLFEMYPKLKDFKVTRGKGKSTNAAIYTGLGKIEINFSKFKPYMSIPSNREKIDGILHRVINHEIQHAIQDSEGFAQGVSPNAFRPDAPIGKLREMEEADGRMVERYNAMSYTEKALGEGVRLKERILENRKEYNALASKYRFGMDGYTRAAGEVEARNTEKRIGMTEEERRASLASETEDVAREDQILLGVDNADGEVNTGSVREHRVYHGSGADFDAFDHSHMGEGEGAQAYGWGTYVTEVEGIGRTYAIQNTTTHNDALRALQHDVDAISDQLNRHRDDLKYDEEQLKRANEWRAEAELDYELFRNEAEELKEKYGESSPKYRNHLFNDIYTDEMKRAQSSVKL